MNLLTPLAGFLIGYGGIMGYQVIDSTYKGEMPGPKSFGYFIGGMTLLSAATIYALGRTDKVFNAGGLSQFTPNELTQSSAIHGDFDHASLNYSGHQNMILSAEGNYNDFIEDMEGVIGKYGEMKDFDSGYNPQDNLLKARMVVEVDDDDFDNVEFDAEMMMPEKQCVICGGPYTGYGHNPEPIFPMSRGRCCDVCNATVVIPYRMGGMNFRFGEDFEAQGRDVMGRYGAEESCMVCSNPPILRTQWGHTVCGDDDCRKRAMRMISKEDVVCDCGGTMKPIGDGYYECKSCYDTQYIGDVEFGAETVRKFRNRFDKTSPRGNRRSRAATGVKRNIWKNFFRKDAEDMSDELDMVMAQLYEIEDMKNPTPEDLTNYQNLLTRYYEMVRFNAEQKTARVRTMSGKPVSETLRKLKQDKNLSAKDARTRKEIKAENMEVFEAPKTMTPLQAKNKFIALAQPYWIKALTKLKEGYIQEKKDDDKRRGGESEYFQQYDYDIEDTNTYLKIAKSPSKIKNIIGCDEGDTVLREMIPDGFYHLINYPRENYYTWENTMFYFQGPKAIQKQLKALLPIIKGKVTVKPKATKKTTTRKAKPKAKAKTGRKAPTISATRRKIGTRMRGNDGKMWEVKKSGKSQRWMAGAETFEAEVLARDWKWKGIKWTPEEEATLSQEEKEVIAEQLYNDWKEDLNS